MKTDIYGVSLPAVLNTFGANNLVTNVICLQGYVRYHFKYYPECTYDHALLVIIKRVNHKNLPDG